MPDRQRYTGDGAGRQTGRTRYTGTSTSTPSAPEKKGGGGLRGFIHKAAHVTASKVELAGHDLKAIPVGVEQQAVAAYGSVAETVRHPWISRAKAKEMWTHPLRPVPGTANTPAATSLGKNMLHSTESALLHPTRDPFATALVYAPVFHGAGSVAARANAAASVARSGEGIGAVAKAAGRRPVSGPRLIRVGDTVVPLHASTHPGGRILQAGYDKVIQKALDTNPEGRIAAHGSRRVAGSLQETARYQQRMRAAPADVVAAGGRKLGHGRSRKMQEAALRLTSENTTAEEAASYHRGQAERGISPKQNMKQARLYDAVAAAKLVTRDAKGNAVINAAEHPDLARLDAHVAAGQRQVDQIAKTHGLMTEEGLAARRNGPARIRAGGTYVSEQAANEAARNAERAGRATEYELSKQGRADVRATTQRAVELDRQASSVETSAFNAGTRRTEAERLALRESEKANRAAASASSKRFANAPRAEEGSNALRLLQREQRLAQISYERFKGGKIGPGVLDRSQKRLARITDRYEASAPALVNMRGATREGAKAAAAQEEHLASLREAEQQAVRAHDALLESARRLRGSATGARYRIDFVKASSELKIARARATTERAMAEELARANKIVGGENARPGRGFVSYRTVEPKASAAPVSASAGPVVGPARSFIRRKPFTGHGLEHGMVPDNTSRLVAQHMKDAYKFVNTDQFRRTILQTGSDTRRTSRDVLIRNPDEKAAEIPTDVNLILGRGSSTVDELSGHHAAFSDYVQRIAPGVKDKFAEDKAQAIGTPAPKGFRWVDQNHLGELGRIPFRPSGRIARTMDSVNSAVTAATVYFKIGHVGTRVLTNAATNILQGSARPHEIGRSVELWQKLSDIDRRRALAAAGQHGFDSMPHQGKSTAAKVATAGSAWWAKHADAPFRFNSIAYEARKAGIDTPEQFRWMLDKLENPEGLNAAQVAKLDWIPKRANRAGIAYDRLNESERQFLTRGLWFYPWIKGATVFAGHTFAEHPYKTGALGVAAVAGRNVQQQQFGDLPSYEGGLIPLGRGSHPFVADFSTFSPFSTPADVLGAVARPGELSGFLNPVYGSGVQLATGTNQYGEKTNSPVTAALQSLVAPTPESQVVTAYLHRHQDQSNRMFHTTPGSALLRTLVGPGTPRRVNKAALNKAAARERSGR